MPSRHAGDIMVPLEIYPHIPYWFTLRQAVAEMENSVLDIHDKSSLPRALLVFDEKYRLMGIVRRRDILRGLEPGFLEAPHAHHERELFEVKADPDLADLSTGRLTRAIAERAEHPVSDVMQPINVTVDYDDHLAKVIYKMVSNDLNLLPVLKDGKVVGVVRSVDAFQEVARLLL